MENIDLTLELHHHGAWHRAATLTVKGPAHTAPAELAYDIDYVVAHQPPDAPEHTGWKALGVGHPLRFEYLPTPTWPPFLLDLLPQGHARQTLARALNLTPDATATDLPLLLRAAGAPIGNIRIHQAWAAEQDRLTAIVPPALTLSDIVERSDRFLSLAADAAVTISGSSGVQGVWPKLLLTQADDGLWYPDPAVPDARARAHVIVKWRADRTEESALILAAEAPYLEVARRFGLRCGQPLRYQNGVLLIPRFDRRVTQSGVTRLGQESLVSAAGIAAFGHIDAHETYLDVLRRHATDPEADITEYVLRDLLDLAMGNPDNHGRNTALQKDADGTIHLAPLYDFCPMRLDPAGIIRSTRWACMLAIGGTAADLDPDWALVCETAAGPTFSAKRLKTTLATKAEFLSALPAIARHAGVSEAVIARAVSRAPELARAVARLAP